MNLYAQLVSVRRVPYHGNKMTGDFVTKFLGEDNTGPGEGLAWHVDLLDSTCHSIHGC